MYKLGKLELENNPYIAQSSTNSCYIYYVTVIITTAIHSILVSIQSVVERTPRFRKLIKQSQARYKNICYFTYSYFTYFHIFQIESTHNFKSTCFKNDILKWRPSLLMHWPLSVVFHCLASHFGWNGSDFLVYCLLKRF